MLLACRPRANQCRQVAKADQCGGMFPLQRQQCHLADIQPSKVPLLVRNYEISTQQYFLPNP